MNTNSTNLISFTSRKPEIRKADDIQRRAKANFPMLSFSYVNDFYISTGKGKRITQKKISLFKHLKDLVFSMRDSSRDSFSASKKYIPYAKRIAGVKKAKVGNCMENAYIAIAALASNGYTNTKRASLKLNADFIDKRTGKIVYSGSTYLDHSCAVTDMNTGEERNIVVDPWLGFADSKSGAIARYKKIQDKYSENMALNEIADQYFTGRNYMTLDEIRDDFNIKTNIEIQEDIDLRPEDTERLAEYTQATYPELII